MAIEVEVHRQLQAFWRDRGELPWPHHLTLGRLVARSLRSGQGGIFQVGGVIVTGQHRPSYLAAALLLGSRVAIVAEPAVQQRLLAIDLPRLQAWLTAAGRSAVPVQVVNDRADLAAIAAQPPSPSDLVFLSPDLWLADGLARPDGASESRPLCRGWPTILDGAEDLETWARSHLTVTIDPADWLTLSRAYPWAATEIYDQQAMLIHTAFQHPPNPYECFAIEPEDRLTLAAFLTKLRADRPLVLPRWEAAAAALLNTDWPLLVEIDRVRGQVCLKCEPVDLAPWLAPLWSEAGVVAIGGVLAPDAEAKVFRDRVGWSRAIADTACVKFADRDREALPVYLPDRLPFPNTPEFQTALMRQLYALLALDRGSDPDGPGLVVILVGDRPLQNQVASRLAADFGSRVVVERTCPDDNGILVCGWAFWRSNQALLPTPRLLVIAALPLPSLEDPRVASRVAYCKRHRQDWFRGYLLPEALSELQRAVAPLRSLNRSPDRPPTPIALLDSRAGRRSYGPEVLAAIGPISRVNYLDPHWF